ncbi:ATP-binding protein [Candidatus Caldatribacterium saccharofermentans]|mgnify:CR=1 FL=1|uniref:ATP-binding protein n=1 Tax=Candidatus Caldatribacterium saccharofermentans TaxID=1454753 RepID=UPI003D08CFF5
MNMENIIESLELRMKRMISFLPERRRPYFNELEKRFAARGILLAGPRGSGKTTFLLSLAQKRNLFYISTDDPIIYTVPFQELAQYILVNYDGLIIDEVHYLKDWPLHVKSLYDSFPNKTIWLSDSSPAVLRKGVVDLSRRFVVHNLPLMSLREYIYFETGKELPKIPDPFDERFTELAIEVLKHVDVLKYFRDYKEHGTRPFYKEGNFRERMRNVIEKSIHADIPYFVGQLSDNHLGVMRAIISHLAFSKIPTVNIEAMCRDWNLGKEKLYQLLWAMEEIGLVNVVRKTRIEKPYSKGAKILFADPVIYSVLEGETGNFREAFVVFVLKNKGEVLVEKDETKGDLIFNDLRLEIGGSNKKPKEADYVIRDDIDLPVRNVTPMWVLGMGW